MYELRDFPNLRHLRAFSLTARHKSVHKAASAVFLSQPAVTQAIIKLEAEFGQTFFERSPNGMICTEVGNIFLARIDRAFAELRRACDLPADKQPEPEDGRDPTRLISTAQLRAIVAIANHGNFTMAARALDMSRPTIQRTARALENALNYKLFLRSSRGIRLTAAGERFARGAKLAAREIDLAREEIDQHWGQKVGRMVVGSLPLSRVDLLPQAIIAVLNRMPDLSVRIMEGPYESQLEALRNGDLDIIVGALRKSLAHDDVRQEKLFADPLSIVARANHPLTRHAELTLSDTVGYDWIVPAPGTPTRTLFHKAFRNRALAEPKRLLEVSSHVSIRALLTGSDRIAIISRKQIRYEEEAGTLKVLPIDLPESSRAIGITTRKDWEPSKAQKMLIGELKRIASGYGEVREPQAPVNKTRKGISLVRG